MVNLQMLVDKVGIGPDPGTHLHFVEISQNDANSRMC